MDQNHSLKYPASSLLLLKQEVRVPQLLYSLLSYHTATEVGLIELKVNQIVDVNDLEKLYPNLFVI